MQTNQPRRRPPTITTPTPAAHNPTILDDMDALLDEIDDVLTEEQEFASHFRQRGGQ